MTLTLAASTVVAGSAGSGSAITCSIFGDELGATGTDSFKLLYQGVLGSSPATLYTVGGAVSQIIKTITLVNVTGAPVTVLMFVGGTASANKVAGLTIPANGSATYVADGWSVYDASGFKQYIGSTGPTGARGLTWQGAWSGATTYAVDDAVYYATTGGSYRSLQAGNLNHTPPAVNDSFWYLIAAKGDQGIQGVTGSPGVITTLTAGAGLTGGGSSATVTVDVVSGDGGLTVMPDAIYSGMTYGGTVAAASKTYVAGDRGKAFLRSNSGSAMTDTLPSLTNATPDIGCEISVYNLGTTVAETITFTTPAGTFQSNGTTTYVLRYGCRQTFVWTGTQWLFGAGNANLLRFTTAAAVAGNLLAFHDTDGRVIDDTGITAANVVQTSRSITGTGNLTGGGTLAADRTIDMANMAQATLKGRAAGAGTGAPIDLSPTQAKTLLAISSSDVSGLGTLATQSGTFSGTHSGASSGTNTGDQTITLTGDTTGSGIGSFAVTVAKIQGAAVTTTAPTNGQVLQYVSASTAYIPFSYAGDVLGGPSAATVNAIQGRVVSALQPLPGQNLEYISAGYWSPSDEQFNIVSYGADPTNTADSTLAIYNAIVACATYRSPVQNVFTSAQVTCTGTFAISVLANAFPGGTNKIVAQTTLGSVEIQYTGGGGTVSLTGCTVTKGIAGGVLLSGSMIGFQNGFAQGGTVFFPVGLYKVTQQIIISFAGVALMGPSGSAPSDAPGVPFFMLGGAWLNWAGSPGGIVVVGMPWTGSTLPQLQGFSIRNMNISCQGSTGYGLAAGGILILSATGFALENIMVYDPAQFAYGFDVLAAGSLATGTAHDCTRFTVKNLKFRCLEAAGAIAQLTNPAAVTNLNALSNSTVTLSGAPTAWPNTGNDLALFQAVDQLVGVVVEYLVKYTGISGSTLTGCTTLGLMPNESNSGAGPGYLPNALMFAGSTIRHASSINATGIRLHGSATANTCCAAFLQLTGQHGNGPAMSFLNCDSNIIYNPMFNRNGTGIGIALHGSTIGAIGTCRNNAIYSGSAGAGGIRAYGTGAGELNYTFPSQDNYWYGMEVANGEPSPTIGLGATLFFSQNGTVNANPQLGTLTGDRLMTGRMTTTQVIAGTTQAAITGLNFPILQPGVQYEFESTVLAALAATATSTAGFMTSVTVPPGATLQCALIGQTAAGTSKTTFVSTNSIVNWHFTTALTAPILIKGMVFAGTATSHTGTVQINAASASGSASTISNTATIQAGSYLRAVKVG